MNSSAVNIMIVGDPAVGKTTMVSYFNHGVFTTKETATIGVETISKRILVENQEVIISVWDTAGQERYNALTPNYLSRADGVLVVFSLTNEESIDNSVHWIKQAHDHCIHGTDVPLLLVGTHLDKTSSRRVVDEDIDHIIKKMTSLGWPIVRHRLTSAVSGEGIEETFHDITQMVLRKSPQTTSFLDTSERVQIPSENDRIIANSQSDTCLCFRV